jgi:alpha-beta hydrolase superfamily lysophospholipase
MEKLDVELVYFNSTDGFELVGALNYGKKKSKKLIIHVHGMTGDFCRGNLTRVLSNGISKTKYDFFSINTRGAGIVTKFYGKKQKKVIGTAHEKIEECIYDIDGAIRIGKKMGYTKFVLSGHSTGCQKVAYYQGKKNNRLVESVILLSPCDDYNVTKNERAAKDYQKHLKLAKKMVKTKKGDEIFSIANTTYSVKRWLSFADPKNVEAQVFNYDGRLNYFSKIKKPILITFGSKDYFADHDASESLAILRKKTDSEFLETVIVPNAEHNYMDHEIELVKVIKDFLKLFK